MFQSRLKSKRSLPREKPVPGYFRRRSKQFEALEFGSGELNSNREPNLNLTDDLRPALEKGPYVAIVVDLGFSYARAKELSRIDLPLTWAIIPFQSASRQTADLAKKGIPFSFIFPCRPSETKMAVLSSGPFHGREEIKETLKGHRIASGCDRCEQSPRFCCDLDMRVMRAAMEGLKETGLSIFLDSRTAASSVAAFEAKGRTSCTRKRRLHRSFGRR